MKNAGHWPLLSTRQSALMRCVLWNCGCVWTMLPVSFPSQELLPANSTFRRAMPYILCTESSKLKFWVDFIGHACVFGYSVVIPSFILYLYSRQRVVLRSSRMMTAAATFQQGDLKVCLHEIQSSTTETKWLQDAVLFSTFAKVVIFCHSNEPWKGGKRIEDNSQRLSSSL